MKMEISSIYEVTDYKTGQSEFIQVSGDGEETIKFLRTKYPRFTKFVLEGFEINGKFVKLKFRR